MTRRAAVLGAGGWGTALAVMLARRGGPVALWARQPAVAETLDRTRENVPYLPGVIFPANVHPTASAKTAVAGPNFVVVAIPSHALAAVLEPLASAVEQDALLVSATKGILPDSLETMTQVVRRAMAAPSDRVATLSGQASRPKWRMGCPRPSWRRRSPRPRPRPCRRL